MGDCSTPSMKEDTDWHGFLSLFTRVLFLDEMHLEMK